MLEALDALGRASVALVWLPLAAWTVFWLASEAAARLPLRVHPLPRYRATQALLFALPLGLALAPLLDPARLVPWLDRPVVVYVTEAVGAAAPTAPVTLAPAALAPSVSISTVLGGAVLLLIAAAMIGLGRLAAGVWTLRRLRAALPAADARLSAEAAEVARTLGLRRSLEVVATDAVSVPMTFGVIRPVVVLPPGLTDADRRLALAHEIVHVQRRDALAAWLEGAVAGAFPWHPGVRRLARACDLLREMAADATLLARREVSRPAYAELVSSFVSPRVAPTPLVAVGMADSASHVHQRLLAMTHPSPLRRTTALLGWALAGLVLTGASLAVTASRALAQEKRVEVRSVEASEPPVVYVDGVRHQGSLDALNSLDIHSIDILRGEAARERFGVDHALDIVTREGAEALGLPAKEGTVSAHFEDGPEAGQAKIRVDVTGPANGDGEVRVERRRRVDGEPGEIEVEMIGGPGGRFEFRSPDDELKGLGVDPEDVATVDVRIENGQRTTTVRLKNGEVLETTGPAGERDAYRLRAVDGEPEAEKAGAPSPFEAVRADPNPVSDALSLSFELAEAAEVSLRVYDIEGRELLADGVAVGAGSRSVSVDVSDLPAGTYIYRLSTPGTEARTGRFTVAR